MSVTNHTITNDICDNDVCDNGVRDEVDQLIAEIRKPEHLNVRGWSMMRVLHPFQDRLTRGLLRTSIASWQLTVGWFLLSLIAYGISAIGQPIAFVAGAIVLFVAIVIDLCDGEIGRARARHMSAEEDLHSFIKGMFLDRMCHTICTPIWPLAVGFGLYQMHAASELLPHQWTSKLALVAAIALAAYHSACRALPHLEAYLVVFFRQRVAQLANHSQAVQPFATQAANKSVVARIASKIELWVRNGKRFNLMILAASMADVVIALTIGKNYCYVLLAGFIAFGATAIVLLAVLLISRIRGQSLIELVVRKIENSNPRGN